MTTNQQHITSFVSREIVPWVNTYQPGPWLTQHTVARFQAYVEREAVSYIEDRALAEAVTSVLGAGNPAAPFIVAGLKEVLDAQTPALVRFAREHPEVGWAGVCMLVLFWWRFGPEW